MNSSVQKDEINVNEIISETREFLISDLALRYYDLIVSIVLQGSLSLSGVVANLLNAAIFLSLDLTSSMNVAIFVLSITDMLYSLFQVATFLTDIAEIFLPNGPVDLPALRFLVFFYAKYSLYLTSCGITALISVERCCCVLFPFTVKQIFTRKRCIIGIVIIYSVITCIMISVLAGTRLEWTTATSDYDNHVATYAPTERFTIVYKDLNTKIAIETIQDALAGLFLFILFQSVLSICTVLMIYALNKSSKIRTTSKREATLLSPGQGKFGLTLGEKKLVKTVLGLSVLSIFCNIPRLIATIGYYFVPEMQQGGYGNLYKFMIDSTLFICSCGLTLNFFVYFFLNSTFRKTLVRILIGCRYLKKY